MQSAGQALSGLMGNAVGRAKFDVELVLVDGHHEVFKDAVVHHADGWLLVCEYKGENWNTTVTNGFHGSGIVAYKVTPHQPE